MCCHGEASLFWVRPKGLGFMGVQRGLEHHICSEPERSVGSLSSFLGPWDPLNRGHGHRLGGLDLLQTQPSFWTEPEPGHRTVDSGVALRLPKKHFILKHRQVECEIEFLTEMPTFQGPWPASNPSQT